MRWFNFAILLLITLVLEVGMGRLFGLGPQRIMPDLLLLLAMVLAFRGPADKMLLCCWILGLAKDLTSQAPLGAYAFSFGLVGLGIIGLRELLYGESLWTLAAVTFVSSFLIEQFVFFVCLMKGMYNGLGHGGITLAIMFSALFTAALTPYGQWLIHKLQRRLSLPARRRYG